MNPITAPSDYQAYTERVAAFLKRNQVRHGCYGPFDPDDIPHFSHSPCACCDRQASALETYSFASDNGPFTDSICSDCVYFLAYGVLDDETMHNLQQSIS